MDFGAPKQYRKLDLKWGYSETNWFHHNIINIQAHSLMQSNVHLYFPKKRIRRKSVHLHIDLHCNVKHLYFVLVSCLVIVNCIWEPISKKFSVFLITTVLNSYQDKGITVIESFGCAKVCKMKVRSSIMYGQILESLSAIFL